VRGAILEADNGLSYELSLSILAIAYDWWTMCSLSKRIQKTKKACWI